RNLGALLQRSRYFDGRAAGVVTVARDAAGVKLTFIVPQGAWEDPGAVGDFQALGRQIRSDLFADAATEVRLADGHLKVMKTLPVPSSVPPRRRARRSRAFLSPRPGCKMGGASQWVRAFQKGLPMSTLAKRFGVAALVLGVTLAAVTPVSAQIRPPNRPTQLIPIDPNPYIAPGVRLQQYAYNTAVLGKVYRNIPPYLLGYNPYPLAVNYGPVYNPQIFQPSGYTPYPTPIYGNVVPPGVPYASPGYMPYGSPYSGGYSSGGGGIDPVTGLPISGGFGGGYSNFNNPYYWNPYSGGYSYTDAANLQAYGQLGLTQEQARILREQANQAKLDTRKKYVDTL